MAIVALGGASWPPAKSPSADNSPKPTVTTEPLGHHGDAVYAVAVGQVNGRSVAVTGGADNTVRVWDLATRKSLGQPMTGHTNTVEVVAVGQVNGRPVAVTGSLDGTVRVWDLSAYTG
ncbi:hypothetical protein AB0J28_17155 [Streptosporangium canum]|uniref:hypothetical protein n=1 Tax=Streptosporangium canum TaxID=324952 RepID=UPI00343ED9B0